MKKKTKQKNKKNISLTPRLAYFFIIPLTHTKKNTEKKKKNHTYFLNEHFSKPPIFKLPPAVTQMVKIKKGVNMSLTPLFLKYFDSLLLLTVYTYFYAIFFEQAYFYLKGMISILSPKIISFSCIWKDGQLGSILCLHCHQECYLLQFDQTFYFFKFLRKNRRQHLKNS